MDSIYQINPQLDIPIYQQLVDAIRSAIKKGQLVAGERLPTVQEMTQMLSIARGTVKRTYDELERAGLLEKVQGRGTFVRYQPANSGSRKEQAMALIDDMLNQLDSMGLSAAEINIFLNLKLRERSEQESYVKIAVVECNAENLSQMTEQLRHISGVDIYSYQLESVRQYPYMLGEDFDLVVTTASHAEFLVDALPLKSKIARVALRPSARYLSQIIKLRAGKTLGIIGYSQRFGQLLYETCKAYTEGVTVHSPLIFSPGVEVQSYLQGKDAVLVPKACEKYFSTSVLEALSSFSGQVIECYYEMDEGSVLYLEAKIKRILEEKTI